MGGGGQGREFFREIQSSELAKVHGGEGEMQRGLQRTGVPLDFIISVYSCHVSLIPSASVRSLLFLSFIEPIFA